MFDYSLPDFSLREKVVMIPLVIVILWLGVFPQPILNTSAPVVDNVLHETKEARAVEGTADHYNVSLKGGNHEPD
jgi:NADH-quinone oxidoreductase subunit M